MLRPGRSAAGAPWLPVSPSRPERSPQCCRKRGSVARTGLGTRWHLGSNASCWRPIASGDRISMLVRLARGANYPAHSHAGVEELHLLDGELWIDDHKLFPGRLQLRPAPEQATSASGARRAAPAFSSRAPKISFAEGSWLPYGADGPCWGHCATARNALAQADAFCFDGPNPGGDPNVAVSRDRCPRSPLPWPRLRPVRGSPRRSRPKRSASWRAG